MAVAVWKTKCALQVFLSMQNYPGATENVLLDIRAMRRRRYTASLTDRKYTERSEKALCSEPPEVSQSQRL